MGQCCLGLCGAPFSNYGDWCWERRPIFLPDIMKRGIHSRRTLKKSGPEISLGNATIRQMAFSKLDLFLHREWAKDRWFSRGSITARAQCLFAQKKVNSTHRFRFSHLFSSPIGYRRLIILQMGRSIRRRYLHSLSIRRS